MVRVNLVPLDRKLHLGRMVLVLSCPVMLRSPLTIRHALVVALLLREHVLLVVPMRRVLWLEPVQIVMSVRLVLW